MQAGTQAHFGSFKPRLHQEFSDWSEKPTVSAQFPGPSGAGTVSLSLEMTRPRMRANHRRLVTVFPASSVPWGPAGGCLDCAPQPAPQRAEPRADTDRSLGHGPSSRGQTLYQEGDGRSGEQIYPQETRQKG